eukprot:10341826-Alexandrium_andersonii.AAC.1
MCIRDRHASHTDRPKTHTHAGSSGKTRADTNAASADTELTHACNWALMQNASVSALFLPLRCP